MIFRPPPLVGLNSAKWRSPLSQATCVLCIILLQLYRIMLASSHPSLLAFGFTVLQLQLRPLHLSNDKGCVFIRNFFARKFQTSVFNLLGKLRHYISNLVSSAVTRQLNRNNDVRARVYCHSLNSKCFISGAVLIPIFKTLKCFKKAVLSQQCLVIDCLPLILLASETVVGWLVEVTQVCVFVLIRGKKLLHCDPFAKTPSSFIVIKGS